jgi:hypothetical protein
VTIGVQSAARIGFAGLWVVLCLGLGIFGGFAGEYVIGLPLTVLIPLLLVRIARFHGLGGTALIAYGFGILPAVAWALVNSFFVDATPQWPPSTTTIAVSALLVILVSVMFYAAFARPEVRSRLP